MRKSIGQRRKAISSKAAPAQQATNKSNHSRPVYPFTAIVGQGEMKLALLLSVIDPYVGGVIVMGHRGTAKSTAVRALADLLPPVSKVKDCFYGCDPKQPSELCDDCCARLSKCGRLPVVRGAVPVIDLPLGATEDRVCGTLDIERALADGVKAFEPGLLARANRGFLYIDEVNLLDDHLVDVLLDAAASGRNVVEREGISVSHPARFALVGSGNPEEGELRPQLLDRFGLYTQIATINDLDDRVEIVERRERFEREPDSFLDEFKDAQEQTRQCLVRAKKTHPRVAIDRGTLRGIAELCLGLNIDGHRGELTIARAARALAALEGRTSVIVEDVKRVAVMSLRHRMRKDPLERIDTGQRIEQAIETVFAETKATKNVAAIR
ncbi:MAG TPA: magnesium chelatase ATPase subunit I [Blastocatellia bacterium]|nr:magnesium chelatase ATPase subunit I [Blastocatellia bacterium]